MSVKSVPIGVRVYVSCTQGGRKYMEDTYHVSYQTSKDLNIDNDLQFIYFAIFDGHGGDVAAIYARDHLLNNIIRQRCFWSNDDNHITQAITKGFVQTHNDMIKEVVNWPKTASGLPSTSGTTASIVFIMNGKYYTGHVGDSRIVLGRKNESTGKWMSCSLTRDHKPESPREKRRIEAAGGQVMNKSGVDRVVWNRPKLGHKGPVRRSTSFDQIPFLAVARSLGDLWSFNSELNTFIVSPEPDVKCIPIDANDKCLLLASDGLWNMMLTKTAIKVLQEVQEDKYSPELMEALFARESNQMSPSRALIHFCLNRWYSSRFRADNTTVLAVMIDHNQDIELNTNLSNNRICVNPNGHLFEDEEDSDDGYDEAFDAIHFFGQLMGYNNKNNCFNDNNITSNTSNTSELSQVNNCSTLENNSSETPKTSSTSIKNELIFNEMTEKINSETKVTTNMISKSKVTIDMNNDFECYKTSERDIICENERATVEECEEYDDYKNNESSRDSGTESPVENNCADQLTDEEYAALPSLVNVSQNQWELFVEIDPKNINSKTSNIVVSDGFENSNEDNKEENAINNYIYNKSFIKHPLNTNEMPVNDTNFWSQNDNYLTLTSIKPRTSLPLNFGDNHSDNSFLLKDNNRTASNSNNLYIFDALKSDNNFNNTQNDNKMSQIYEENNQLNEKNISDEKIINNEYCLRRISIDNNKVGLRIRPKTGTKRRYSSDFSPPSKHLRSSLWTRPLVSKQQLMKLNFTRSLKQLAVGRLTRSRLRPIKILKSFKNNCHQK